MLLGIDFDTAGFTILHNIADFSIIHIACHDV